MLLDLFLFSSYNEDVIKLITENIMASEDQVPLPDRKP